MYTSKVVSINKISFIFTFALIFAVIVIWDIAASPPVDEPMLEIIQTASKNPPKVDIRNHQDKELIDQKDIVNGSITPPTIEWAHHKTSDSLHPDGPEQQMVWLMNRARTDPTQEGIWLATTNEPDVAGGRNYFNVDLDILQSEFASYDAKPPAAFDVRLYNAAKAHSDDLISRDAQDHNGQFDRVTNAGFNYTNMRGNVFSYGDNGLNAHAAFNIDWGSGTPDGMQTSRGHRKAIMAIDGDYTNVGIAGVSETDPNTSVGPLVVTGNYARAGSGTDHYNVFLVGTVWEDDNDNAMYDPGEGIANVTVMPDQGTYYAITSNSGGYAIPLDAGTYEVTFSGAVDATRAVVVGSESVLLDIIQSGSPPINNAPNTPSNPIPDDNTGEIPINQMLSWQGGDSDGDTLVYTIALGTNDPPPVVSTSATPNYTPITLISGTTYYWGVTVSDGISITAGPIWTFTTVMTKEYIYLAIVLK